MLLHQPNRDYAFAHVRRRLDDQFVWPWFSGAIHGYVEDMNVLHYTPDGWDVSLGTSPLTADWQTSFEEYLPRRAGQLVHVVGRDVSQPAGGQG